MQGGGWRRTLWTALEGPRHLWTLGSIGAVIALTALLLQGSGLEGLGAPLPEGVRRVLLPLALGLFLLSQGASVLRTFRSTREGRAREVAWASLPLAMVAAALAYAWAA